MRDPRITALARQAVEFSVALQKGERLLIDAFDGADDFVTALLEAAYEAGGVPLVNLQSNLVNRAWLQRAPEEALALWCEHNLALMRQMDAYIVIRKARNNAELSDLPPERLALYNRYYAELHHGQRIPHTKWCVLRYPNAAMAQAAGMSTPAFEDFYYSACNLNYGRMNEAMRPLVELVGRTDRVRVLAPGTDLSFSIKGHGLKEPICGRNNLPCGEVGLSVAPDSVNGAIAYNVPSLFQGFVFRDIYLRLEDGVVVEARCNDTARLNRILDTDPGARRIGEFAMSFNPFIVRSILDVLFDEKMERSIHFTPGNSPVNPSAIHWDIVQSHAGENGGGEIWFDDVLIRKNGLFIGEGLARLNPEALARFTTT